MSINQENIGDGLLIDIRDGIEQIDLDQMGIARPTLIKRIRDDDGSLIDEFEVTPVITETFRARTKNENRSHRTLCGDRRVEPTSEDDWHITIEGYVIQDQLDDLLEMRPADGEIKVISEAKTFHDTVFDEFEFEQGEDMNTYDTYYQGERVEQTLYRFRMTTEDDDQ